MDKYMCPFASCRVMFYAGDYGAAAKCPCCDRRGYRQEKD